MPTFPSFLLSALRLSCCLVVAVFAALPAQAEKADRGKQMVLEADRNGELDGQRGSTVLIGNAVVAQGTMLLRADRIEVRERSDGYRSASATGSGAKPATWRQKADGAADEWVEGGAERIEFDEKANTLRLAGAATLRRMRGSALAQEVTGSVIVWDNTAEVFKVEGGAATPANPGGRVRVVLSPRPDGAASAASPAAPAASPAAPAASGAATLAPVRSLGERK